MTPCRGALRRQMGSWKRAYLLGSPLFDVLMKTLNKFHCLQAPTSAPPPIYISSGLLYIYIYIYIYIHWRRKRGGGGAMVCLCPPPPLLIPHFYFPLELYVYITLTNNYLKFFIYQLIILWTISINWHRWLLLNNHTSKYNSFILVLYRRYKNHVSVCPPPHVLAHCYATDIYENNTLFSLTNL